MQSHSYGGGGGVTANTIYPHPLQLRDSHGAKSNENRGGASIQFQNIKYDKSASNSKNKMAGLILANQSNSAYTRAEKMMNYQELEFPLQTNNINNYNAG